MTEMETFEGAIGIDLGTTYSCVAVFMNNQVDVIPNDQGNRITPSCVVFHGGNVLVGDSAHNLYTRGVKGAVYDAKRMIGRRFSDRCIQEDLKAWPFHVSAGENDRIIVEVEHNNETLKLEPEQISATVLKYLKESAERHLGKQVTKAVVTVPAYFNDAQRERTKAAAQVAGLEVLRIINEPTAAALCYGLGVGSGNSVDRNLDEPPKNVFVFDMGGGTFDVSVITVDNGSFAVRATNGDTHLGGQDVDAALVNYVLEDLKKRFQVDGAAQPRILARIRAACERVKRVLSHVSNEELLLEGILPDGEEYSIAIPRAKLENLCAPMFQSCMEIVKRALKDAGVTKEEVDEVILVGGSSRIPRLQDLLSTFFGGKRLCSSVHPDEAVAIGAAIQASILSTLPEQKSERTENVVLMDVVPLSIGVELDGGKFDALIKRNTVIPYAMSKEYSTVENNQKEVEIEVFEGERPLTKHNHKLGSFSLEGIAPAKKGDPTILVKFSVDANGILSVTAEVTDSAHNQSKTLVVQNSERLSDEDVMKMIEMSKKMSSEDAVALAVADAAATLDSAFRKLQRQLDAVGKPYPSQLESRIAFMEHGKQWVSEKLPTYTDVDAIKEKVEKILSLCGKASRSISHEGSQATEGKKRKRSSGDHAAGSDDDGEGTATSNGTKRKSSKKSGVTAKDGAGSSSSKLTPKSQSHKKSQEESAPLAEHGGSDVNASNEEHAPSTSEVEVNQQEQAPLTEEKETTTASSQQQQQQQQHISAATTDPASLSPPAAGTTE